MIILTYDLPLFDSLCATLSGRHDHDHKSLLVRHLYKLSIKSSKLPSAPINEYVEHLKVNKREGAS